MKTDMDIGSIYHGNLMMRNQVISKLNEILKNVLFFIHIYYY